jgi:hypothetical protein
MKKSRGGTIIVLAALVAACGGVPDVADPVGEPLLPDLVPDPPVDVRVTVADDGTEIVRFSSTLVNVGDGDFELRATLDSDQWAVQQEIPYSESGGELVATDAGMVWGGDGHDHWHIERVASYHLVPLDESGEPIDDGVDRPDAKVGFCFFDHSQMILTDVEAPVFSVDLCGKEDATRIMMGMSPGWADVYGFDLPGQSIDIKDLRDGEYRIWAEADAQGWFTEENEDNNVTWVDIELFETEGGQRAARVIDVGPRPR